MKYSKGNISSLPILSHMKCNCDATDIDVMFRNCCVSVDGCTDSLQSITLFDTGAHMSYVSRQVAAWITDLARRGSNGMRTRMEHSVPTSSVSLAGTSKTCPVYGCITFDLTFFNEVMREHETIHDINANVIDSCIDVIIGRPVIRGSHLIHKIPSYFDEANQSNPLVRQSVVPVTVSSTSATCVGARPCDTCSPFVAQGYDNTLCSLAVRGPDQPPVPKERLVRPHAKVFADPPQTEGTNLVDRSRLLDPFVDADDIDWKDNPFERAEQVNLESPDELLAMIQFEGSPWLQEQLRVLRVWNR